MGKEFRRALDRRGHLRRNVSHRTMMSSLIAWELEHHRWLNEQHELQLIKLSDALLEEMREFRTAAEAYLRGDV